MVPKILLGLPPSPLMLAVSLTSRHLSLSSYNYFQRTLVASIRQEDQDLLLL